jgi:hypothetical protein
MLLMWNPGPINIRLRASDIGLAYNTPVLIRLLSRTTPTDALKALGQAIWTDIERPG